MKKLEEYVKEEKERLARKEKNKLSFSYGMIYVMFLGLYLASFFVLIAGIFFIFRPFPPFQLIGSVLLVTGFLMNYFSPMLLIETLNEYERKKKRIR